MKNLVDELRAGAEIVRLLGMVKEDRPALCRAIADEFAAAKAEIERLRQRLLDAGLSTGCDDEVF